MERLIGCSIRNCISPVSSSSLLLIESKAAWLVWLNIFNSSRNSSFVNLCIGEIKSSSLEEKKKKYIPDMISI